MFMNRKSTNSGRLFLLGLVSGAVASMYFSKMMNPNSRSTEASKGSSNQNMQQGANNQFQNIDQKELFETFLNGTENELKQQAQASDLNG